MLSFLIGSSTQSELRDWFNRHRLQFVFNRCGQLLVPLLHNLRPVQRQSGRGCQQRFIRLRPGRHLIRNGRHRLWCCPLAVAPQSLPDIRSAHLQCRLADQCSSLLRLSAIGRSKFGGHLYPALLWRVATFHESCGGWRHHFGKIGQLPYKKKTSSWACSMS